MRIVLVLLAALFLNAAPVFAELVDDVSEMSIGDHAKFPILDLEPTQYFIGKRVAEEKREYLESLSHDELRDYLRDNPVPVYLAPNGKYYMVDHHHLSYAARLAGRDNIYILLKGDWSKLKTMSEFEKKMIKEEKVFLFDEKGAAIKFSDLPTSVMRMTDSPYRSLAYYVREKGGYRKTRTPFAEMKWALFFMKNMKIEEGPHGFEKAIGVAYDLARSDKANGLPGKIKGGLKYCERFVERGDD